MKKDEFGELGKYRPGKMGKNAVSCGRRRWSDVVRKMKKTRSVQEELDPEQMMAEGWARSLATHIPVIGGLFKDRSHDVYYHPEHKLFSGKVYGQHFRSKSEKGFYQHLTDRVGMHPADADKFIQGVKKGNKTGVGEDHFLHHSERAVQHMRMSKEAHFNGDHAKAEEHMVQVDHHMGLAEKMAKKSNYTAKERKIAAGHHEEIAGHINDIETHDKNKAAEEHKRNYPNAKKVKAPKPVKNLAQPKQKEEQTPGTPMKKKSQFDFSPGKNESLTEEKKPLAKVNYHKDSEMFHGHILDQEVSPQKEPQFMKFLTTEVGMDPKEASNIIKQAKEPVENDEKIRKHMAFAKLWKSYAAKAKNSKHAQEFSKGADFHARKAKSLGYDKKKHGDGAEEQQQESVNYVIDNFEGSDIFHSRQNFVDEEYVTRLVEDLSGVFTIDQIDKILTNQMDENMASVVHKWCNGQNLRKQRIVNVQNEGKVWNAIKDTAKNNKYAFLGALGGGMIGGGWGAAGGTMLGMKADEYRNKVKPRLPEAATVFKNTAAKIRAKNNAVKITPDSVEPTRKTRVTRAKPVYDDTPITPYNHESTVKGRGRAGSLPNIDLSKKRRKVTKENLDEANSKHMAKVKHYYHTHKLKNSRDKSKSLYYSGGDTEGSAARPLWKKEVRRGNLHAKAVKAAENILSKNEGLDLTEVSLLHKIGKRVHNVLTGRKKKVEQKMLAHQGKMVDKFDAKDREYRDHTHTANAKHKQLVDYHNSRRRELADRARKPHDQQDFAAHKTSDSIHKQIRGKIEGDYAAAKSAAHQAKHARNQAAYVSKNMADRLDTGHRPTFGKESKRKGFSGGVGYGGKVYR